MNLPAQESTPAARTLARRRVWLGVAALLLSGAHFFGDTRALRETFSIISSPEKAEDDFAILIPLPPPPAGKNRTIHFFHVGKAGGTTLRNQVLRLNCILHPHLNQNSCTNFEGVPEAALSRITKGMTHYSQRFGAPLSEATDLLFVVRDPIARFFSWFPHLSPLSCRYGDERLRPNCLGLKAALKKDNFQRKFFFQCYPTVIQMVQALNPSFNGPLQLQLKTDRERINWQISQNRTVTYTTPDKNYALQDECNQFLSAAFESVGLTDYGHLTAGYRHYAQVGGLNNKDAKRPVWVVRTEFLWEDIGALNAALGGSDEELEKVRGGKETHGSESRKKQTPAGTDNLQYLCCALLPDMLAYRDIVDQAVNLAPQQKQQTYQITLRQCQVDSWADLEALCTGKSGEAPQMESTLVHLKHYTDPTLDYPPPDTVY